MSGFAGEVRKAVRFAVVRPLEKVFSPSETGLSIVKKGEPDMPSAGAKHVAGKYYSAREVAAVLGVEAGAVQGLVTAGLLPCSRHKEGLLFTRGDIVIYLQRSRDITQETSKPKSVASSPVEK